MLPLTRAPGSQSDYRLTYSGAVGVAGANVTQTWDLTLFPPSLRKSPVFKKDLLIFVRQGSTGLSDVSSTVEFVDDLDGVPIALKLTLTAASVDDQITLDVWFLHSVVGAVCTESQLYFVPKPAPTTVSTSYAMAYGSSFAGAGADSYHRINGEPNSGNIGVLDERSQFASLLAGNITRISWNTANADNTTVYKIWVQGLVVAAITLTGPSGEITLGTPVPVALGDLVAVEYDSGTPPNNSGVSLLVEA